MGSFVLYTYHSRRKKFGDGSGMRSKCCSHIWFILSDVLEVRTKSRWRCVCRRSVSRGQSKSVAPTWGRAGALAGARMIKKNRLLLISLVFIWNTCMDVAWRGWSKANASTSSVIFTMIWASVITGSEPFWLTRWSLLLQVGELYIPPKRSGLGCARLFVGLRPAGVAN